MSFSEIDKIIFFAINHTLQNSLFDSIMPFITSHAYLLFSPLFILYFLKDKRKACVVLVIAFASLALSDWSSFTLKHVFERQRPCNVLDGVHLLVGCSGSFSMPSNHAANAFAFAAPFYILFKTRLRYIFILVAFLVGVSRISVGVHYPSDVLVGAGVGIAVALSVIGLYQWSSERFQEKPSTTVLFVSLLTLSLFRIYYIQYGYLDVSPDEAHYWEWSRRLDWSYYSKGPMIAYLICIGTVLFGDNAFGIRIMAVIFSVLSSIILYMLGKRLYDERVGLFSAIVFQIVPLFSAYSILFTIDSPFIFFWILSLFLFYRSTFNVQRSTNNSELGTRNSELSSNSSFIPHPSSSINWLLLGLSIGLGLLTKYTMAFFYLCAFFLLLVSKEHRRLLFSKGPYIAFLVSLIVFSPVILWNVNHDWVTFRHTAGHANIAEGIHLSLKSSFEFFGSQLGIITPLLFILMAVSLWRRRREREGAFLFWFSVPIVVFFLLKSLQGKVEANWALPGYITGIIAFSEFSIKKFSSDGRFKKTLIVTAVILSVMVTSIAHFPSILNLPSKQDPTLRLRGWKSLGVEVTKLYEQMSAHNSVFIFSDSYQVSSELAFYVKGHPITYCMNLGRRINQYDLWPGFRSLLRYDAIFVTIGDMPTPDAITNAFEKVEKRTFTAYNKQNKKIREYSLILCYDFKGIKEEKTGRY